MHSLSANYALDDVLLKLCDFARSNTVDPNTRRFLLDGHLQGLWRSWAIARRTLPAVIDDYTKSKDVDLQQRCMEFQNLLTSAPHLLRARSCPSTRVARMSESTKICPSWMASSQEAVAGGGEGRTRNRRTTTTTTTVPDMAVTGAGGFACVQNDSIREAALQPEWPNFGAGGIGPQGSSHPGVALPAGSGGCESLWRWRSCNDESCRCLRARVNRNLTFGMLQNVWGQAPACCSAYPGSSGSDTCSCFDASYFFTKPVRIWRTAFICAVARACCKIRPSSSRRSEWRRLCLVVSSQEHQCLRQAQRPQNRRRRSPL